METIRVNTFETNSSSTHSITISKYQIPRENNIPRNLTKDTGKLYDIEEYGDCGGGDETYACDTLRTEVEKLSFIINMIASVIENGSLQDKFDYKQRENEQYIKEYFNIMVNSDLFRWLKEVVIEETGTEINYIQPTNNWFPFYETTYDETQGISSLLDTNDKDKFKARVKDIIFNKDIIIENEVCPYGMERY